METAEERERRVGKERKRELGKEREIERLGEKEREREKRREVGKERERVRAKVTTLKKRNMSSGWKRKGMEEKGDRRERG